jgi:hypothetical protein
MSVPREGGCSLPGGPLPPHVGALVINRLIEADPAAFEALAPAASLVRLRAVMAPAD